MMPGDPTNAHILEAIQSLSRDVADVKRRTHAIENARTKARSDYDRNWADVRTRLERIELQVTRTNGRVTVVEDRLSLLASLIQELREWKAYMSGVSSAFSWWKPAVATLVAASFVYLVAAITH